MDLHAYEWCKNDFIFGFSRNEIWTHKKKKKFDRKRFIVAFKF